MITAGIVEISKFPIFGILFLKTFKYGSVTVKEKVIEVSK
jgi:hypothetical protein